MTLTLTIELGSDGMRYWAQIARALRMVAVRLAVLDSPNPHSNDRSAIMDAQGNYVGKWEIK